MWARQSPYEDKDMTTTVARLWTGAEDRHSAALYALLDEIDQELDDRSWMVGGSSASPTDPRQKVTRVLGIPGSLRQASFNRRLLDLARSLAPSGVEIVLWDELKAVDPFDEDDEGDPPPAVQTWRAAIVAADALLIATPEYNSSLPGQLKNALDWASRPHELERSPGQAGGGHRRKPQPVRCGSGPGRRAQDPRRIRSPSARLRAGGCSGP